MSKASVVVSPPSSVSESAVGGSLPTPSSLDHYDHNLPKGPPQAIDFAALRAMLVDVVAEQLKPINATIADLQERVDDQGRNIPRLQPVRHPDAEDIAAEFADDDEDGPKDPSRFGRQAWVGDPKGMSEARSAIPMTANGHRVSKRIREETPPLYHAGQRIRLNPETAPRGSKPGVTWGTICEKQGVNGIGVVLKSHDILDPWLRWMYHVYIPGIAQSPQIGFPVDEDQLLPAPRKARGAA